MLINFKNTILEKGFLLTLILSISGLIYFFPHTLLHANSVYFDAEGDGFQTYFTTLYQVNYESSWFHQLSMNYPYGENVFFTGAQPLFTVLLKVFGLGAYTIGIMNLCMLFSIPAAAIFLYLIFKELNVTYLFSAVAAVCISFLSPQVARIQFHFALAYPFFIPAAIYLLQLFKKEPSFHKSIAIAVLAATAAFTQMYFFVFIATICAFFWLHYFFTESFKLKKIVFVVKHFFIQIIIPYLLLYSVLKITDSVTDRTLAPWGFTIYKSNIYGIFYPLYSSYTYLAEEANIWYKEVNGEGVAYIGIASVVISVILLLKSVWNLVRLKFLRVFAFTDNGLLNAFIWCGIICLFYSFGWPFIFDHEDWLKKLGPLRQMRASGRFAWVFFYSINVVLVYASHELIQTRIKNKAIKIICFTLVIFPLAVDAYENVNRITFVDTISQPEVEDRENKLPANAWVSKINPVDYQAIFPLPYFHQGSENMNYTPAGNIKTYSFIASLKTRLPLLAVSLSRTSLSQTFKNIELVLESNGVPEIINELPNSKPFLVIVDPLNLNVNEERILSLCKPIGKSEGFLVYSLEIDSLKNQYWKIRNGLNKELQSRKTFAINGHLSSDSVCRFCVQHYPEFGGPHFYDHSSTKKIAFDYSTLTDTVIPGIQADSSCLFSFWMYNFKKDLFSRTMVAIEGNKPSGGAYNIVYTCVKDFVKRIDGDWVLIEVPFKLQHQNDRIKGVIWNTDLNENENLVYSESMIRQASVDVYKRTEKYLFKNNRYFSLQKN